VAGDKRGFRLSQLAIDDVQVGPTDGAGANAEEDLADARFGRWQIRFAEHSRDRMSAIARMNELDFARRVWSSGGAR